MSATDELRRLLDERGVEWRESVNMANCVFTIYESPIFGEVAAMDNDGTLYFHELNGIDVTPSQAIAATLGDDATAFAKRIEQAVESRKPLTLFGVDYEAVGDVPFCEQVDRWLHGDAPSECRECADGKYDELTALVDSTTRWHQLFGTPERAARMLEKQCDPSHCVVCPAYHRAPCDEGDYDALLEWLRSDA